MLTDFDKSHISQVAEIERLCFSDPWSERALEESLESEYSHFSVALDGESVVGYIGLYAVSGEGCITNVAVHPDSRGRGIGRALVEKAIERGRALGLEYLTLEVRKSNGTARALYEKCGFLTVGERRNFYSNPKEDALIMNYFYKEKQN